MTNWLISCSTRQHRHSDGASKRQYMDKEAHRLQYHRQYVPTHRLYKIASPSSRHHRQYDAPHRQYMDLQARQARQHTASPSTASPRQYMHVDALHSQQTDNSTGDDPSEERYEVQVANARCTLITHCNQTAVSVMTPRRSGTKYRQSSAAASLPGLRCSPCNLYIGMTRDCTIAPGRCTAWHLASLVTAPSMVMVRTIGWLCSCTESQEHSGGTGTAQIRLPIRPNDGNPV